MTVVLVAFVLGFVALFLGLMALGLVVHLWPLFAILGAWQVYRDHRAKRCRRR